MSNNLNLTQVVEAQANPEVPVNDKGGELDAALTETTSLDLTNSVTVTSAQYQRAIRLLITTSGTSKVMTVPAVKRLMLVQNDGANPVTVTRGSTSFDVAAASATFIYTDGTTNGLKQLAIGGGGGGGGGGGDGMEPNDLAFYAPGIPSADKVIFRYNAVRAFSLAAAFAGSVGSADIAATLSTDLDVQVNGTSVGTINFGVLATTPTFTAATATNIVAGDVIEVIAPTVPDASLADIAITFKGSRAPGTTLQPFDIAVFVPGKPQADKVLLRYNASRAFLLRSGLSGSIATAGVASNGTLILTLAVDGVDVGTVTFTTSDTGTFALTDDLYVEPESVLTLTMPSAADTLLADVGITFLGSR